MFQYENMLMNIFLKCASECNSVMVLTIIIMSIFRCQFPQKISFVSCVTVTKVVTAVSMSYIGCEAQAVFISKIPKNAL